MLEAVFDDEDDALARLSFLSTTANNLVWPRCFWALGFLGCSLSKRGKKYRLSFSPNHLTLTSHTRTNQGSFCDDAKYMTKQFRSDQESVEYHITELQLRHHRKKKKGKWTTMMIDD